MMGTEIQATEIEASDGVNDAPVVMPEDVPEPEIVVNRFDIKTESKVIKALAKVFEPAEIPVSEDIAARRSEICLCSADHVMMMVSKTEQARRVMSRFMGDIEHMPTIPTLDYKAKKNEIPKSNYDLDYMLDIMNIFKAEGNAPWFTTRNDYPLRVETENFIVLLAPRIEN